MSVRKKTSQKLNLKFRWDHDLIIRPFVNVQMNEYAVQNIHVMWHYIREPKGVP